MGKVYKILAQRGLLDFLSGYSVLFHYLTFYFFFTSFFKLFFLQFKGQNQQDQNSGKNLALPWGHTGVWECQLYKYDAILDNLGGRGPAVRCLQMSRGPTSSSFIIWQARGTNIDSCYFYCNCSHKHWLRRRADGRKQPCPPSPESFVFAWGRTGQGMNKVLMEWFQAEIIKGWWCERSRRVDGLEKIIPIDSALSSGFI